MSVPENSVFPVIAREVEKRATKVLHAIQRYWKDAEPFRCVIAGGCLNANMVRDVDLFPLDEIPEPGARVLAKSKNASTYAAEPWPIQVCKYREPSVEDLIESFDFAHVQVGAELRLGKETEVVRVCFTAAFIEAAAAQTSWFTGSRYPLSSLIRAGKYYPERMPRAAYIRAVIGALIATVERRFSSWDDFKDQIDAVDLGLLNDEQREVGAADLKKLFGLLGEGKAGE